MKNKKLKLIAVISAMAIMGLAVMAVETPLTPAFNTQLEYYNPATAVWSYDFDDGNLSDWAFYGNQGTMPYTEEVGNFSAEDGALRATGDYFNIATVNSSVAYGTWMFDVDIVETSIHEIVISFLTVSWSIEANGLECYFLQAITGLYGTSAQPRLQVGRVIPTSDSPAPRSVTWVGRYPYDDLLGWKNFIITRESNGQFYIYMNETLIIGFKDSMYTTCNEFLFGAKAGPAIDNIVVSDTVDFDAAPPEFDPKPTDKVIELGQDFRYDLNATDFSGLGTWALNDTSNFAIDSNGVITNATALTLGSYGLNVSVSDSLGFTNASVFSVTVQSVQSTAQPDLTLFAVAGVSSILIIALVVVFMKKRR